MQNALAIYLWAFLIKMAQPESFVISNSDFNSITKMSYNKKRINLKHELTQNEVLIKTRKSIL